MTEPGDLTCCHTTGVLKAMERNPYSPPTSQLNIAPPGPVSMKWYGFLCFLGVIVVYRTTVDSSIVPLRKLWL
jgi:hypothetical protein